MDFTLHKDADRVDFRYSIREDKSGELMTPRIQYVFLELPNSLGRALTPQASVLDNICYAFHEMEHLTERPAELKQEIFKLLFNSAELANFTADERAKYQLDMTTERDIKNQIEFARDEGREEGRVEGIRLSALNMLKDNLPVDTICRYTGLSEEEVEALRS